MTDYYVRKSGSNSNNGTSAATAWLTIDNAANNVAAGDNVYVGAGRYGEQVTMDTSGSSGNQISFIADVAGEQTGDAGLVIITAYVLDHSTASRASCINPNSKTFFTFRGFCLVGGNLAVAYNVNTSADNYEGVIFEDCAFFAGHGNQDYAIRLALDQGTTPATTGLTLRRCLFTGGTRISYDENATADQDLKISIESCVFVSGTATTTDSYAFWWDQATASTFPSGGISITNCLFYGCETGVYVEHGSSTTYPVDVRNSVFYNCNSGVDKQTSNDGALTSDYNVFGANQADYINVTAGTDDDTDTDIGEQLLGGFGDFPLYRFWGWSPFRPFEPIRFQDDSYQSNLINDANTADAPAFDFYNEARPMFGTVDDRGAVEGRARAERETTTVRTGNNAIRFEGTGFHDIPIFVNTISTTVTVYGQYDSNYTGTLPQLEIRNIPGVADQTDTMVAAADTWEQLSVNFTPTDKGIARIRLISNDTSATGECFFDDVDIS
jgi:hypothetical protein